MCKKNMNEKDLEARLNEILPSVWTSRDKIHIVSDRRDVATSNLKQWLQTGKYKWDNLKSSKYIDAPLSEVRKYELLPFHYTFLQKGESKDVNNVKSEDTNEPLSPLTAAFLAWEVEEKFLSEARGDESTELMEAFFKKKNLALSINECAKNWYELIEEVGISKTITKQDGDVSIEFTGRADILTKDSLYLIYRVNEKIDRRNIFAEKIIKGKDKLYNRWFHVYLNVLNMIFKKERLFILFISNNGVCEEAEFPLENSGNVNNFFWQQLVSRREEFFLDDYFEKCSNIQNRELIESTKIEFDVKRYIQKIMGPFTYFFGFHIDTWVKALVGDKRYMDIDIDKDVHSFRKDITTYMLCLLHRIADLLTTRHIYDIELFMYKLSVNGGFWDGAGIMQGGVLLEYQEMMHYVEDVRPKVVRERRILEKYREVEGRAKFIEKNNYTFHIEATKEQKDTLELFLAQNAITQVIKDENLIYEMFFINAKPKDRNALPIFKKVDYVGAVKALLFLECVVKKIEASLLLGVRQQLLWRVELSTIYKGKKKSIIQEFKWSLRNWWEYDNEDINDNAAFTSFLNSTTPAFSGKGGTSTVDFILENESAIKNLPSLLRGKRTKVAVCLYKRRRDIKYKATDEGCNSYDDFSFIVEKNKGAFIISYESAPWCVLEDER